MIFFCFLFWTPKSFISPDILCHILFWCVRTAFLVWSSTMFNQAIWEHGLSLLEFWASWKFDSRGRLIHACRNMMKYVAFNRSVWFQTVLFCWFSPGLSMTKTQPAHWVVPLLSPNGCRSQLQSPQLNSWLWMVVRACFLSEGIRVRPCGAMRALLWQLTYTNQNHPKSGFDFAEVHVGLVGSWHRHFCFHDLWNLFDQGWVSWYHMLKQESAAWSLLCSLERSDSLTECQAGSSSWKS